MIETKKCPFCGYGETRIETFKRRDHWEYAVLCRNCGAFGPNGLSIGQAIEMWDTRREEYPGAQERER